MNENDSNGPVAATSAAFSVGQLIHHRLFGYRGVVTDMDPFFRGSEDWYRKVARSRPPKDRPWYHVLVDDSGHRTYVAERNLEPDPEGTPIHHPDLLDYFVRMDGGRYVPIRKGN